MLRSPGDGLHSSDYSTDSDDHNNSDRCHSVYSSDDVDAHSQHPPAFCDRSACQYCCRSAHDTGTSATADLDLDSLDLCAPLTAGEVRWFRKDAATSKWVTFNGYDSQRLECGYRRSRPARHACRHCAQPSPPRQGCQRKSAAGPERKTSKSSMKNGSGEDAVKPKTIIADDVMSDTPSTNENTPSTPITDNSSPQSNDVNMTTLTHDSTPSTTGDTTPTTTTTTSDTTAAMQATNQNSPIVIDDTPPPRPKRGHLTKLNINHATPPLEHAPATEGNAPGVCVDVCGGLYQVDINTGIYSPLYWSAEGQTCKVTRGTWFYESTWQPLEEEFSDVIERAHLELFTSLPQDGDTIDQSRFNEHFTYANGSSSYASDHHPLTEDTLPPLVEVKSSSSLCSSSVEFRKSSASSSGECLISSAPSPPLSQSPPTSPRPTSPSTTVIHSVSFRDFYIDWNSEEEVYLHYETASSKLYRVVGSKLGLSKAGTKLCRGYQKLALEDDRPCEISHLVFVVHGIGQMMATNDIIKSCSELKFASEKMQEKFFPSVEKDHKRIEYLPVEWRSSLKLDGGLVDSVTPVQLKGLRQMLNSSALDILYYSSPLHRAEMIRGLLTELNRIFTKFSELQPNFIKNGGKVSIVAHSLGCVIMYDILTNWNPLHIYDQVMGDLISESKNDTDLDEDVIELIAELDDAKRRIAEIELKLKDKRTGSVNKSRLKFKVDKFFCLGSPLSVFLALRKSPVDNKQSTVKAVMPTDLQCRILNIYHPSDPISYRLEPLILSHYARIKPLSIHQYDSKTKPPYDSMIAETCPLATTSSTSINSVDDATSPSNSIASPAIEPEPTSSASWGSIFSWGRIRSASFDTGATPVDTSASVLPPPPPSAPVVDLTKDGANNWINFDPDPSDVIDLTNDELDFNDESAELPFRLDYSLRDSGTFGQAYLAALTAHIRYWADWDVALFVLTHAFGDEYPVKSTS